MRIKSGRIYRYDASAAAVGGRCPCRAAGEPRGTWSRDRETSRTATLGPFDQIECPDHLGTCCVQKRMQISWRPLQLHLIQFWKKNLKN